MKKIFKYILGALLTILMLISGCSNSKVIYSDEYVSGQDQQYWYYASPMPECPMIDTKDGYYFINHKFIYYRDKSTEETIPVCNKPECLHNDESCNAFLGKGIVRILAYYSNKIYYIVEDTISGSMCDILYEFTPDGKHKQLHVFPELVDYTAFHRGFLYYNTTDNGTISGKEEDTQTTVHFYRIPIRNLDSKPELLYEYKGIYADLCKLLCYGNNIYFVQFAYVDPSMKQFYTQMNKYNILDGTMNAILEGCYAQYTIFNDKLAFTDGEGTYLCDLDGQDVQKVWDKWGILSPSSKYLLSDTACNFTVMDGTLPRTIGAIDTEGHIIGSIELNKFIVNPVGVTNDEYLVANFDNETQLMTIYQIPVDKIADNTGQPEVFFEYTGQ